MRWKPMVLVTVVVIVAVAGYLGQRDDSATPSGQSTPQPKYVAAEGKVVAYPGYEVELGSELIARIEKFHVKEGDLVEQGQVIVELSAEDIVAQLHQAEAALAVARAKRAEVAAGTREEEIEQARAALQRAETERDLADKTLQRNRDLLRDKSISRAIFDESEATHKVMMARVAEAHEQLKLLQAGPRRETLAQLSAEVAAAEANINYARTMIDKSRVTSPIAGTVIERYLNEGEAVIPEKPIAVIADTTKLRINAEVDETDVGRLHLGDMAEVSAYAYPGKIYKARIEEIARYVGKREIKPNNPAVNLGLKIIQVKLELLEPTPLQLGMTVDVRVMVGGQ